MNSAVLYTHAESLADQYSKKTKPNGLTLKVYSIPSFVRSLNELSDAIFKLDHLTVISHGGPGNIQFPTGDSLSRLNLKELTGIPKEFFSRGARVYLIGCEVGQGVDGEYFMIRLAQKLFGCTGGSLKASNRTNAAFTWPWVSDIFMIPGGPKEAVWKTVDVSPVGNVTNFKNVKFLKYRLIGDRLRRLDTRLRSLETMGTRADKLDIPKFHKDIAEARSDYQGAKKDDYDKLRFTCYKLNRLEEMIPQPLRNLRPG